MFKLNFGIKTKSFEKLSGYKPARLSNGGIFSGDYDLPLVDEYYAIRKNI
jgi:hypothetical protein